MSERFHLPAGQRVIVTGAAGQDARYLIPLLIEDGAEVHAIVRRADPGIPPQAVVHCADLLDASFDVNRLLDSIRPDYIFNLAGQSSVRESISAPQISWAVNADWTARLLEAVRRNSPASRLYQASSSEMFGRGEGVHDEDSPLDPVTPYAASKAAAHVLCRAYRNAYGLRIACGILFNHESKFRGAAFLTAKVAAHVRALQSRESTDAPLRVGNLEVKRDWGSAEEFAYGILLIAAQTSVRSDADRADNYRDYVLATGSLTSVQQLVDRAFVLGGFDLTWELEENGLGRAFFRGTRKLAVESAPEFHRAGEPRAIAGNPARALRELGWRPSGSIDGFLSEMVSAQPLTWK